jgi:hypothetical protein
MVIILVHWLIKRGVENEHAFKSSVGEDEHRSEHGAVP